MSEKAVQTWTLTIEGVGHRVEASGSLRHQVRWYVDGEQVAEKRAAEERLHLTSDGHGALGVWFGVLGAPRRATFFPRDADGLPPGARALTGLGGLDLEPEPDSPAAEHEDRVRAHPRRYAAIRTAGGVARVVVPLVVALLIARLAFSFDWPDWDLPDLPIPSLPALPWPDLPEIPVPDISLPGWLRWILQNAKYVVPILVAFALARAEIQRRRKQDELREARARDRDREDDTNS